MKLFINTSNLYIGGGAQVAISFICELKKLETVHEYYIALSLLVENQICEDNFPDNFHFYLIKHTPASLKTRKQTVLELNALEEQIQPDIVFSIFGPSYWKPKANHLMGFAVVWVLYKDSPAFEELNFFEQVWIRLKVKYVSYYAKKDASHYIIETEDGKNRLSNVLNILKTDISVVGNSYSAVFDDEVYLDEGYSDYIHLPEKKDDEFRLLLISHNYSHKNIKIINQVIPLLGDYNIKFVLTVDEVSYKILFPNKPKQVMNFGSVSQKACPSLYTQCDVMFLPTLLEVFSAAYPEAMKMEKPILTSNYSFATDVCQDAALYFDPLDPKDIAIKIKKLLKDKELQRNLVQKGKERLKEFETARTRAEKYVSLCEKIVKYKIEGEDK